MTTIIAKNNTTSIIEINDMFGIEIPASGQKNLTDMFALPLITRSSDLKSLISSGDITINDGASDLNSADGLEHTQLITKFYVKQQVGAEAGWVVGDTTPLSPSPGDGWYNTIDNFLYIYDGSRSKWLSINQRTYMFNHEADASDKSLKLGENNEVLTGIVIPQPSTILRCYGMVKDNSGYLQDSLIFQKNFTTNIATLSFGNSLANERFVNMSLNIDLDAGDIFKLYAANDGDKLDKPVIFVEMAWRPGDVYVPNT